VAFASPIISNANGILNVGFENDPVYRALNGYNDFSSSLDNLVLATSQYMQGNYDGLHPPDQYAHNAGLGFKALGQLQTSMFFNEMSPDSVVIFDAFNGMLQDITPGRDNTGVFYLGENVTDSILGRNGGDHIEGFAGDDTLNGGTGDDSVTGSAGDDALFGDSGTKDTAFFSGNFDKYTVTFDKTTQTFTLTGPDGKDTATGFEFYDFDDKAGVTKEALEALTTAPPPPGGGVPTPNADVITATDAAGQLIDALAGADQVTGLGGPDTLIGGEGVLTRWSVLVATTRSMAARAPTASMRVTAAILSRAAPMRTRLLATVAMI
jgi:Ca2+-binding RTX toxin-like protein